MKKLIAALALAPLLAFAQTSTPEGFTDNLDEALAAAKANGQYIYVCFSGSDWCGWCKRLEQEVLSKPEFKTALNGKFQLVYIDNPQNKEVLSDRAKVENPKLVKKYEVRGYPSALILSPEGEQIGRTGYKKGGPEKYAEMLLRYTNPEVLAQIQAIDAEIAELNKQAREKIDEIGKQYEAAYKELEKNFLNATGERIKALEAQKEALGK